MRRDKNLEKNSFRKGWQVNQKSHLTPDSKIRICCGSRGWALFHCTIKLCILFCYNKNCLFVIRGVRVHTYWGKYPGSYVGMILTAWNKLVVLKLKTVFSGSTMRAKQLTCIVTKLITTQSNGDGIRLH